MSIDANIELSEEDGVFDVYGFLTKMRQQRRGLVETLVSYFDPSLSHTSAVRHKIQSVYCTFPGFFFLSSISSLITDFSVQMFSLKCIWTKILKDTVFMPSFISFLAVVTVGPDFQYVPVLK